MKRWLFIIIILLGYTTTAYANWWGWFGFKDNPFLGTGEKTVYTVTDNGGEAFVVTDNGGEDYEVR